MPELHLVSPYIISNRLETAMGKTLPYIMRRKQGQATEGGFDQLHKKSFTQSWGTFTLKQLYS